MSRSINELATSFEQSMGEFNMQPSGKFLPLTVLLAALVCGAPSQAQKMEKVKVATSFLGLWDTSQPAFCKDRGEYAKAGLDVDVISTRGGSENVQSVIAGGNDIAYSPGIDSAFAAYAQGAKVKIIGSEFIGQNDSYFYVLKDSPMKTIDDLKGKTVAYPRPGGATEAVLIGLKNERHIDFKPIATGGLDATFTMVNTKQVDVGYAFPPNLLDAVDKGQIRVLFSGDDVKGLAKSTGRVNMASDELLTKRPAVAKKFMEITDRCIDWMYAHKAEAAKMYAALNKVDEKVAARGMGFYKRETLAFGPIKGINEGIQHAVTGKFIDKPLTAGQIKDMMDIIYTTPH